jgi:hypothetical protein
MADAHRNLTEQTDNLFFFSFFFFEGINYTPQNELCITNALNGGRKKKEKKK